MVLLFIQPRIDNPERIVGHAYLVEIGETQGYSETRILLFYRRSGPTLPSHIAGWFLYFEKRRTDIPHRFDESSVHAEYLRAEIPVSMPIEMSPDHSAEPPYETK